MTKTFTQNQPAINMTLVGFGQAGGRMVDVFAGYQDAEGKQIYNCLALNSNQVDLKELKNISSANQVSLELGGLGKDPEKAVRVLETDETAKEKLKSFIQQKVRPEDELVLFFAGLGGGTGTSTIIKAISEFYEYHNQPIIKSELVALINEEGKEAFQADRKGFLKRAFKNAESKMTKIGVVAALPRRDDGADVLRQVNNFAQQIWKMANDPTKGIAFVMFPDNQYFTDKFKALSSSEKEKADNYRDYANRTIAETIHEINTAANQGGTSVTMDARDLKRAWTEHRGCLVLSKLELPLDKASSANEVTDLLKRSLQEPSLHESIQLSRTEDGVEYAKKVFHVGLLSVIDPKKNYGNGGFIEGAKEYIHENLAVNGTVFDGYIEERNNFKVTAYSFYKVDGLPARLEKGLYEELKEYMERNKKKETDATVIASYEIDEDDSAFDIDFEAAGLEEFADTITSPVEEDVEIEEELSVDEMLEDIDFSKI